jgi:hypothetical protein
MGSKEEAVEAEPRDVAGIMVATDMSPPGDCLGRDRDDLERSLALETRVGTSERSDELIDSDTLRDGLRDLYLAGFDDEDCDVPSVSGWREGNLNSAHPTAG